MVQALTASPILLAPAGSLPALEAALSPADVDYLYFVSQNDGSHAFSRTLEEHNRAVEAFRRAARAFPAGVTPIGVVTARPGIALGPIVRLDREELPPVAPRSFREWWDERNGE